MTTAMSRPSIGRIATRSMTSATAIEPANAAIGRHQREREVTAAA